MIFTARKSRQVTPGALSVSIRLNVPEGDVTPDDVSSLLTSALTEIAQDFGTTRAPISYVLADTA